MSWQAEHRRGRSAVFGRAPVGAARAWGTLLLHALAIWALCGATMGIGLAVTSIDVALWIHLAAAPVFAAGVTWAYFRRFGYTGPFATAAGVLGLIVLLDFFVVALRSLEMFRSARGTWIPFVLIFAVTDAVGVAMGRRVHA